MVVVFVVIISAPTTVVCRTAVMHKAVHAAALE